MVVPSLTRPCWRKSGLRTKHPTTGNYEGQPQERRRAAAIGGFVIRLCAEAKWKISAFVSKHRVTIIPTKPFKLT